MKEGPDIALVAALIGDPARANMLTALLGGGALTAGELARHAGITAQTASTHLARLREGGLVAMRHQGRHRYFTLAGDDVGRVLEGLMGLAARAGHARVRPGPRDPALRQARVCYDHLAGDMGVALLDGLVRRGAIAEGGEPEALALTGAGRALVADFGIDLPALAQARRPVCKACLDWSVRRSHLAGGLGAALLGRFYALGWAARVPGTRVVAFTPAGRRGFAAAFAPPA
ncbi:MAG: transcriptional regulator [Rhodospirillales bacterium 70-18]|nr:MAG: transcriptional regulator [Rhodospirillales bacterium 70-18]